RAGTGCDPKSAPNHRDFGSVGGRTFLKDDSAGTGNGRSVSRVLLAVEGLKVRVGDVDAVAISGFELAAGKRTGLIGESGSGKTLTALAIMGLLPEGMGVRGSIRYGGSDLLTVGEEDMCRLRGDRLAMAFHAPMTA